MRIKKIELENEDTKAMIDMRNEAGYALQTVAIVGGNGSGKTLSMNMALRLFQSTAQPTAQDNSTAQRYFGSTAQGLVEFEYNNSIHMGVIKDGYIVQKPTLSNMKYINGRLTDGCMFYGIQMRYKMMLEMNVSFAEATIRMLYSDIVKGDIRNCMIWIDDFDAHMDIMNARELFRNLMRACMAKDCQLICTSRVADSFTSIGERNIKHLSNRKDYATKLFAETVKK